MEYYTYAYLREDGTPYYIGKGKSGRILEKERHNVKVPPKNRIIYLIMGCKISKKLVKFYHVVKGGKFLLMIKIDFRNIIGHYSLEFPAHDSTTAWYEWNMYVECCESLNVQGQPNWNRFMRYRNYLKEVGVL